MDNRTYELIDELSETRRLDADGFEYLVAHQDEEAASELARRAVAAREPYYGTKVFVRGLIEFSNICKNDCLYCGLRASNSSCERYRLSAEDVLSCTDAGYELGFRTFVLQSGEDGWYNDERLCALVAAIHERHPDCAITRATHACARRGQTATSCATRPRTRSTTQGSTPRPCRSRTACAACTTCASWAMRWAWA